MRKEQPCYLCGRPVRLEDLAAYWLDGDEARLAHLRCAERSTAERAAGPTPPTNPDEGPADGPQMG